MSRAHFAGGASSRLSLVVLSVACMGIGEGAGSRSSTSIEESASSSGSTSGEITDDAFDQKPSSSADDEFDQKPLSPVSADDEFDQKPSSSVFGAMVTDKARGRGSSLRNCWG